MKSADRSMALSAFFAGSIITLTLAGVYFWINRTSLFPPPPKPIACTMEAKLCPDGSSVGRTGPNCEFATCPNMNTQINVPLESTTSGIQ